MSMSRLERERRLRRLSLSALARLVRCDVSLLGRIERAEVVCYPALRRRLAEMLEIPMQELFADLDAAFAAARASLGERS